MHVCHMALAQAKCCRLMCRHGSHSSSLFECRVAATALEHKLLLQDMPVISFGIHRTQQMLRPVGNTGSVGALLDAVGWLRLVVVVVWPLARFYHSTLTQAARVRSAISPAGNPYEICSFSRNAPLCLLMTSRAGQ